jgi:hypothetical protein
MNLVEIIRPNPIKKTKNVDFEDFQIEMSDDVFESNRGPDTSPEENT